MGPMKISRRPASPDPVEAALSPRSRHEKILAIGLTGRQLARMPARLFGALGKAAVHSDLSGLTGEDLGSAIAVLSPLIGRDFDAVDVAIVLHRANYGGHYFAFAENIPDPEIAVREVAVVAPDLSFELLDVGALPHLVR
jgi:hypothetical protein